MKNTVYKVLTIAGSDSSGGAGVQADLKTMIANGVYGMSAITALTAQNTLGVTAVQEATPAFLAAEIDAVFTDIRPDAVKIGMVASSTLIETIAERLRHYDAKHIVVDPVMVATSGARLIAEDAADTLQKELFPIAEVITPNLPELEVLTGTKITSREEMERAASTLAASCQVSVLAKGGHFGDDASDLLVSPEGSCWFEGKRLATENTHGTGCTLSSAIASNLAKGFDLRESVSRAKAYLTGALKDDMDIGHGHGPLNHAWALQGEFFDR